MSNTIKLNHCPRCGAAIPAGAPQGLCPKCVLLGAASGTEAPVAATATSEIPSLARVAAAFPQLEILELVGRGGMGFVFKARQSHLGRLVALKLLPDKLAKDPRFAERFNREGRVLARLNHPNIVSVYDFGMTEHFYFLLMEFVDGVNLRQAMQAGRFSPGEALRIVPKICEALQYAHEQGILHRDIKPENILLDARGQVKIADFGIAKLVGEEKPEVTLTATGSALGTPHYMAPEQLEKPGEVDHRADIYSLGVVFYEMLTGELPIGRFAAPSSKTPVGTGVDEVVFRTLEKDRERRYQSAGEMKTRVEHLGEGDQMAGGAEAGQTPGRLSWRSVCGAALVGLSLPMPVLMVAGFLTGRVGMGPVELGLTIGSLLLPGLGGTLLGALGLNEIRAGGGRVTGLPFAVFATLTWPLAMLVGLAVGLAAYFRAPTGVPDAADVVGRVLVLALPAGAITFVFGVVHATLRWARRSPVTRERGVLKWVFLGLLIAGVGMVMTSRIARRLAARAEAIERNLVQKMRANPLRADFRVAKGQVVTFEFLRRETGTPVPVPGFAGFVVAPDDERARLSVVLTPANPLPDQINRPAWRLSLMSEDGASAIGGVEDFGELISNLPSNYVHSIEPDSSSEMMLTRPSPDTGTNQSPRFAHINLSIVSRARGKVGGAQAETTVGAGSTNWTQTLVRLAANPRPRPRPGEVLAYQWLKSPVGTNATNAIRFTFTNVELREEESRKWLAMDYAADVRGNCEEVFRMDGEAEGETFVTRKTSLLVTPQDSPAVLRQRFQWQIPKGAHQTVVNELVDEFSRALVGKSFLVPEGEQRPLLHLPVGAKGDVSVAIGAKLRDPLR